MKLFVFFDFYGRTSEDKKTDLRYLSYYISLSVGMSVSWYVGRLVCRTVGMSVG